MKLFKLIKHINGGAKATKNEAIKFKGKYISNPMKIADLFNKQYSSGVRHVSIKMARRTTKDLRKKLNDSNDITDDQTRVPSSRPRLRRHSDWTASPTSTSST